MNVLITGANGFIGRNLSSALREKSGIDVLRFGRANSLEDLNRSVAAADCVFHLAGINRPKSPDEFRVGNVGLTEQLCEGILRLKRPVPLLFASSVQAQFDNPYGMSKLEAEEVVKRYSDLSGADVTIVRLQNVFGKWCRPNYNSAVATFCHNTARDLPIEVSDPNRMMDFVYIDDVVGHFLAVLESAGRGKVHYTAVKPSFKVTLGRLTELIRSFRRMRDTLIIPDLADDFARKLGATYLSYLPTDDFAYPLTQRRDSRGTLAEFVKAPSFGQAFVSRTAPGVTRGDHYHHTKFEKFLVLEGQAVVRFRQPESDEVTEYPILGSDLKVVDIPPGYAHSIENVGHVDLVTLFWASEIFDPTHPDTHALRVLQ
jgi:UDP-2-acetamido-2,6-beta-L-arabino-hexul-4-ose reductase